jgi:hypothetical protein
VDSPVRLEMNPARIAAWQRVGPEATPVLVVDDFLTDAEALRRFALGLAYRAPGQPDRYPGVKAFASLPGAAETKSWVAEQMLAQLHPNGRPPGFVTEDYDAVGAFSMFTATGAALPENGEDQHTDGFAWLAMVHHLSLSDEGRGTALWQHRPTGLTHWLRVDPVRMHALELGLGLRLSAPLAQAVRASAPAQLDEVGRFMFRPRPGRRPYSNEEDADWKLVGWIPARWNRLVVYPTWQIHSVVDMSGVAELTVDNARLTFNQMIEYPAPRPRRADRTVYDRTVYRDVRGLPR